MNKPEQIVNPDAAEFLPDGVYLNLPDADYFSQPRLGSTDIKALRMDPVRWWWKSDNNPLNDLTDEQSKDMQIGSAFHALALEGTQAFESRYYAAPNKEDYPGVVITIADITARLVEIGQKPISKNKGELITQLSTFDPGTPIWEKILEGFAGDKRQQLAPTDYAEIILAARELHQNPHFQMFYEYGIPELSIFWTDGEGEDAVLRRGRLDMLKPNGIEDLKSITIIDGEPDFHVLRTVDKRRYDLQAADHKRALIAARNMKSDFPPELARVLAAPLHYTWYFWDKKSGPSIHTVETELTGDLWNAVDNEIERALNDFRAMRRQFGMAQRWQIPRAPLSYEPGCSFASRVLEEVSYVD